MQKCNISLKILLSFFQDPLLEVYEVEGMRIVNLFRLKPFDVEREVVGNLLAIEYPVDHVATEQTHFNFISGVGVDFSILVD